MLNDVVVRLKFLRSFLVLAFLANGGILFLYRPLVSFIVAFFTAAWFAWCIRCPMCGKSPFIKLMGRSTIGSAIPERKCSRCGTDFLAYSRNNNDGDIGANRSDSGTIQ